MGSLNIKDWTGKIPSLLKGIFESTVGHKIAETLTNAGSKALDQLLSTTSPPRADLSIMIEKISDPASREKLLEMIGKANDEMVSSPNENETVTALCKYIGLISTKLEYKNEKTGEISFVEKEGLEVQDIINQLENLGKIAIESEEKFWVRINLLINDIYIQRFKLFIKWIKSIIPFLDPKSRMRVKLLISNLKAISNESAEEIKPDIIILKLRLLQGIKTRNSEKPDYSIISSLNELVGSVKSLFGKKTNTNADYIDRDLDSEIAAAEDELAILTSTKENNI